MTSREADIVEILRTMRPTVTPLWAGILHDAADEIERLREKIKEYESGK
jgi:hypothetical protein